MIGPIELLEKFKKYEYLLNIDKKTLGNDMFNRPEVEGQEKKSELSYIRVQLLKFDIAEQEILNISNNVVDYPLFQVQALKIKSKLSGAAYECKKALLVATSMWCTESTTKILETYVLMKAKISTPPTNEKELVMIKEFIKVSKEKTQVQLTELLKDITKH